MKSIGKTIYRREIYKKGSYKIKGTKTARALSDKLKMTLGYVKTVCGCE